MLSQIHMPVSTLVNRYWQRIRDSESSRLRQSQGRSQLTILVSGSLFRSENRERGGRRRRGPEYRETRAFTGLSLVSKKTEKLLECDDLETRIREPRVRKPLRARNLRIPQLKRSCGTRKRPSCPTNSYRFAGSDFSGSPSFVE